MRIYKYTPTASIKHHSFTLIEMLVLITIISILAALFMPALKRSIEAANSLSCVNNMKQISTGFMFYRDDFNGYMMPPVCNTGTGLGEHLYTNKYHWDYFIGRYYMEYPVSSSGWVSLVKDSWKIFICPEDERTFSGFTTKLSYVTPYAFMGDPNAGGGVRVMSKKIRPSSMFILCEPQWYLSSYQYSRCGFSGSTGNVKVENTQDIGTPHIGNSNFLFIDGHVKAYSKWLYGSCEFSSAFSPSALANQTSTVIIK